MCNTVKNGKDLSREKWDDRKNGCSKETKNQNKQKMEWLMHTKREGLQPWLSNDLPVLGTIERWVHRNQNKSCFLKEAYFSNLFTGKYKEF